jgi:hypothetical protein
VLHGSIFYLYVCNAKNNVREGISLKKVLYNCNQTKNLQSNRKQKQENSSGNKTGNRNNLETNLRAMKTSNVQKTENRPIKKTISFLSIKLGQTDLMIGCWMSQIGASSRHIQKRISTTNF